MEENSHNVKIAQITTKIIGLAGLLLTTQLALGQRDHRQWIPQQAETAKYSFAISVRKDEYGLKRIQAIKISSKETDEIHQVISNIEVFTKALPNAAVQVQDFNFDDHPDFRVFQSMGTISKTYDYYCYDLVSGQFKHNAVLSSLSNPRFNAYAQTITTNWRANAGTHSGATYKLKNGRLDTLSVWQSHIGSIYFGQYYQRQKNHGYWKEHSYYFPNHLHLEGLYLYARANKNSKRYKLKNMNSQLAIRKAKPLWFYVKTTDITKATKAGWIPKKTLLPGHWYRYSASTPKYYFEKGDRTSLVQAIRVVRKSDNQPVQIFNYFGGYQQEDDLFQVINGSVPGIIGNSFQPIAGPAGGYENSDSLFQTSDYNSDGYEDFRVQSILSTRSDTLYDYYLYQPKEKLFGFVKALSKSPNLSFNPHKKRFISRKYNHEGVLISQKTYVISGNEVWNLNQKQTTTKDKKRNPPDVARYHQKVFEMNCPIVITMILDSLEVEQRKARYGAEDFAVAANDQLWYQAKMHRVMDSLNIPVKATFQDTIRIQGPKTTRTIAKNRTFGLYTYFYFDGQQLRRVSVFDLIDLEK